MEALVDAGLVRDIGTSNFDKVCTKPRFSRFSIWISVDLSAVWPCFHHRYSSFTSQTRVPHLHALICVQITPQITHLRTKTSVLYTPALKPGRATESWRQPQRGSSNGSTFTDLAA